MLANIDAENETKAIEQGNEVFNEYLKTKLLKKVMGRQNF